MTHRLLLFARFSLLLLACLSAGPAALAQVNVESLRDDLAEDGFGGQINVSVTSYRGNNDGVALGSTVLLGVSSKPHLAYLNASGQYSRLRGSVQVSKSFLHLRYNYELASWVWAEAFGQIENDRFRRLELRELTGVGPRFSLASAEHAELFVGLLHLIEYNQLSDGYEPVRPDVVHRLGSYASFVLELESAHATLTSTLYYQPRYAEPSDTRLLWISGLDFEITDRLKAGLNATLRHESPVSAGLKSFDLTFLNTLGLTL